MFFVFGVFSRCVALFQKKKINTSRKPKKTNVRPYLSHHGYIGSTMLLFFGMFWFSRGCCPKNNTEKTKQYKANNDMSDPNSAKKTNVRPNLSHHGYIGSTMLLFFGMFWFSRACFPKNNTEKTKQYKANNDMSDPNSAKKKNVRPYLSHHGYIGCTMLLFFGMFWFSRGCFPKNNTEKPNNTKQTTTCQTPTRPRKQSLPQPSWIHRVYNVAVFWYVLVFSSLFSKKQHRKNQTIQSKQRHVRPQLGQKNKCQTLPQPAWIHRVYNVAVFLVCFGFLEVVFQKTTPKKTKQYKANNDMSDPNSAKKNKCQTLPQPAWIHRVYNVAVFWYVLVFSRLFSKKQHRKNQTIQSKQRHVRPQLGQKNKCQTLPQPAWIHTV